MKAFAGHRSPLDFLAKTPHDEFETKGERTMAGQRQPTNLLVLKGKKHFTKAELEERRKSEINAPSDRIDPPDYLNQKQQQKFIDLACELLRIEIMSNLDCDALARYIVARDNYIKFSKIVNRPPAKWEMINAIDKATSVQDRAFKQCQSAARELGLTISSRCKLVVPKKEEPKENKFSKFQKSGTG